MPESSVVASFDNRLVLVLVQQCEACGTNRSDHGSLELEVLSVVRYRITFQYSIHDERSLNARASRRTLLVRITLQGRS
jgi:hypothetical protein